MDINKIDESLDTKHCTDSSPALFSRLSRMVKTVIPFFMLWISTTLMFGIISANTNEIGQDEFYRFIFFLRHPIVITLNLCAMLVMLLHTANIWYRLATKIANSRSIKYLLLGILWGITIFASIILLLVIFGYFI